MGVIHVVTDLREFPGNQPRFELGDISLLVCFIFDTPLRAYRLMSLRYPVWKFPFSCAPRTLIVCPVPNPSGKQTVQLLLQCVRATLLTRVFSRLVTEYISRVVVRLPVQGGNRSLALSHAVPAAHHVSRALEVTRAPSPGALPAVDRDLVQTPWLPLPRSSWRSWSS